MAAEIKFLMDEHVLAAVTRGLQARGVDVLTVQDADLAHTADDRILAYALEQGRVVFTQDEDFLAEPARHAARRPGLCPPTDQHRCHRAWSSVVGYFQTPFIALPVAR